MTSRTYEQQTIIRDAIQEYLRKHGMTSLRRIAKYVEKQTGFEPSPSTIGRLVRDYGYDRQQVEWVKS